MLRLPQGARCALALLAASSLAPAVSAQEKRALRLDDLFALRDVADPRLSPDGTQVAFTLRSLDLKKDTRDTDIYLAPVAGGDALRLTTSPKAERSPRFSPDGKYLAFLSGREGKGSKSSQVFLLPRAGGEAVKLTDLKGGVSDLAWSPDSKRLALIVTDPDPDAVDEDKRTDDDTPKTPKPVVLRRLQFKRDGTGFLKELRAHLHVFDVDKKTGFQVTEGPYDHASPAWSPDGQWLAFTSNRTADPDANRNTDVYVVAPRPHAPPRALTSAPTSADAPAWSPDGTRIVYVEGGNPADMYYEVSHLAVVPAAGGESQPLTKDLDRNPGPPRFSLDGRHVLFLLEDRLNVHLARIPLAGGPVERLVTGERALSAFDVGRKGEIVVLEGATERPKEVSLVQPGGTLKPVTRINDDVLKGIKLGKVSHHEARSTDGTVIDYYLTRPPDAPAGKLPTLLRIHGGPVSQFQNEFDFQWQLFAAQGYLIVAANPRGSSGRGLAFSKAIWAEWGGKDFDDVMAAVDGAIAMGAADPDRLGVGGWSYGGILTDWVVYRTNRFKAAVSGAGIANVLGAYGTDHYQWEYEVELGFPWTNLDNWLKNSKPFLEANRIKTPTLFLCGEVDWNVPLIHSEQMYQALRRLGVPTELVVYPGESHGIGVPSYQKDRLERYLAWYDRYLKPAAATAPATVAEATSFLGQPLVAPKLTAEQSKGLEENLAKANAEYAQDPDSAANLIWVGRRLGYLNRYRDAIAMFSRGVSKFPSDVRFLRFRGHRYITVREVDKAIADLRKADEIIRTNGLQDEPEPDGVPGPPGSTPSTLFFNVYYHLGLAHYLKGDYAAAETAYRECLRRSEGAPDSIVATSRWLYATLRHLGKPEEAAKVVAPLGKERGGESSGYLDLIRLYRGERTAEQVLREAVSDLNHPTLGYGVADWLLVNGKKAEALDLMREIVRGPLWGAFGFAAAEAELARNR